MPVTRREFLGACLAVGVSPAALIDDKLDVKIQQIADRYSDQYGCPGIIVDVAKNGKTMASYAAGFRDINRPNDIKPTDRVAVGSISKPICGYIVARLVQEKFLDWDVPFSKYADDLCKDTNSPAADATLGQLMTHTAGLAYVVSGQDQILGLEKPTEAREMLARLSLVAPSVRKPETKMEYAGGANLAAVMAERVSGKTYEELIAKYIGEELELPTIQMGMDPFEDRTSTIPRGHFLSKDGHSFETYGKYSVWGHSMKFHADATMAITGKATEIAQLMSIAAGFGGPAASFVQESAHKKASSLSPYTLGSWSKTDSGLYHYGSAGEGEWSSAYAIDSAKSVVFVYVNSNYADNTFKGTELVNELNKLFRS